MSELTLEWLDAGSTVIEDTELGESFDIVIQEKVQVIEVPESEFLEFDGAPILVVGTGHISFTQVAPAAEWSWTHNLNSRPAVTLFLDDDPTEPVITDVTYPDLNTVLIEWPSPVSGKAYI